MSLQDVCHPHIVKATLLYFYPMAGNDSLSANREQRLSKPPNALHLSFQALFYVLKSSARKRLPGISVFLYL